MKDEFCANWDKVTLQAKKKKQQKPRAEEVQPEVQPAIEEVQSTVEEVDAVEEVQDAPESNGRPAVVTQVQYKEGEYVACMYNKSWYIVVI